MVKTLYFIRHGQSLANTGAKSMPDAEIPLTELGKTQAETLRQRWQDTAIIPNHIYVSPLLRARQTAEIFNQNTQLPLQELKTLKEFACLDYKTVADMVGEQRAVLAKQYWQTADVEYKDGVNADSFAQFYTRVESFLQQAKNFEHHSLFFGHGIWIGMLAWQLLGGTAKNNADMQKFRQFQTSLPMYNTVVYRLDISNDVFQLTHFPL